MSSPNDPTRSLEPRTLKGVEETLTQTSSEHNTHSLPVPTGNEAYAIPAGFRLVKMLGSGGMGRVFEVIDDQLQLTYALKMAHSNALSETARERFRQEAKAMVELDHPHIARIYAYGEYQQVPYLTMRYLRGGSLAAKSQELRHQPRRTVALYLKIISATAYLHERGFVHRDLKPHNILLDEAGDPYVSDFGLVKSVLASADTVTNQAAGTVPDQPVLKPNDSATPHLTATGSILGTRVYMAPEQAVGNISAIGPKTDVWALGVMMYESLVGQRPFTHGDHDELTRMILYQEPTPPSAIDPTFDTALERIILSCLAKDRTQRPTANELYRALTRWLNPPRPPIPQPTWPKWLALGVVGTFVIVVGLIGIAIVIPMLQKRAKELPPEVPTTADVRQQLRATLARGETAKLVDAQGKLLVPMDYLFDGELIRMVAVGEDCAVDYSSLTYAELIDNVGLDQYILRGEVKCHRQPQRVHGGLYAARQQFTSEGITSHFLTEFRYVDPVVVAAPRPPANKDNKKAAFQGVGQVDVKPAPGVRESLLRRISVPDVTKRATTGKHQINIEGREFVDEQPTDGWRSLTIRVENKRYAYDWNGTTISQISRPLPENSTLSLLLNLKHPIDRPAVFNQPGGVGLIIQGGAVSFRNVTVEPVKAE